MEEPQITNELLARVILEIAEVIPPDVRVRINSLNELQAALTAHQDKL